MNELSINPIVADEFKLPPVSFLNDFSPKSKGNITNTINCILTFSNFQVNQKKGKKPRCLVCAIYVLPLISVLDKH